MFPRVDLLQSLDLSTRMCLYVLLVHIDHVTAQAEEQQLVVSGLTHVQHVNGTIAKLRCRTP